MKTISSFTAALDDFALWLDVRTNFIFPDHNLPALKPKTEKRWALRRRR